MAFDPCLHLLKTVIVNAERECRRLEGKDVEQNITTLYIHGCNRFGVEPITTTSGDAQKLPAPHEMPNAPKKKCQSCGRETCNLLQICRACKESENGKYKSMWKCPDCGWMERSEKFITQILNELGVDFSTVPKASMGIMTVTDEGIK